MNAAEKYLRPKPEKIYVVVDVSVDKTGYMQPKSITWADGRTFQIDQVKDFRPSSAAGNLRRGDCYTILVNGQVRNLFFEEANPRFSGRLGRWFVETLPAAEPEAG